MSFRADRFLSAQLAPRTAVVAVPDIAAWFDGPAEWMVRGLSANELVKVELADRRMKMREAFHDALRSGSADEITAGVRDELGLSGSIEDVYARQVEMVVLGSVDPVIDHSHAAKLGETYPIIFKELFSKISVLTGLGAEAAKKPEASTESQP